MKSLFTVIIIFLLPLSVYGVEWTVKYPMIQPDGSVKDTKISISKDYFISRELPYLEGGWKCKVSRSDYPKTNPTSTYFTIYCTPKDDIYTGIQNDVRCTDIKNVRIRTEYDRDTKENFVKFKIYSHKDKKTIVIEIECKI
ncbi:MAG: hypothetical protein H8D80_02195 [Proteobacteria bacterium]|nr:hypothetical protein [Pseudomonadota bacterium]